MIDRYAHAAAWIAGASVLFLLAFAFATLRDPVPVMAQTPPDAEPTVAPVVADPDWQPSQLQYPVGWERARSGSIRDSDRVLRCSESLALEPVQRSWREMNCQVKRVVEGITAAAVGVAILMVAWSGFTYMLEANDQRMKGQAKVAVLSTVMALCIVLLAYSFAALLDSGIIPHSPWETATFMRGP